MYDNDYIIAVNENGQPYIAHRVDAGGAGGRAPWGSKSGRRPLYIAKKFVNGKLQYIYDRAKAGAKKAWGSKAGRWIDSHDAGLSEEIMRRRLHRKANKAFKNNDGASARRYAHRAAELRDEAKAERQVVKDRIGIGAKKRVNEADAATKAAKTQMNKSYAAEQRTKSQAKALGDRAFRASGEKFNEANVHYSNAKNAHREAQSRYEADTKAYRDAVREGHKANQIYNDSIIGKIERKVQLGKKLTKDEAQQFAAFLARVRNGKS